MKGSSNSDMRPVVQRDIVEVTSSADWRSKLKADARQRIVYKITDTLERHLSITTPEGLGELRKIATRFENKVYTEATSEDDYLRKISIKMEMMKAKHQGGPHDSERKERSE